MSKTDVSGLSQLGRQVDAPTSPEEAVLEKVPNNNAERISSCVSPRQNSHRCAR